jgi:hypothetical protein
MRGENIRSGYISGNTEISVLVQENWRTCWISISSKRVLGALRYLSKMLAILQPKEAVIYDIKTL